MAGNTKDASLIINKYLDNPDLLHEPHINTLTSFYSSCWFIGGFEESALMWTSYSKAGGIAVRIKFSDFKNILIKHFHTKDDVSESVLKIHSGMINYVDYDADFQEWNDKILARVPLPFFKQHYYKQESEYRVLIEKNPVLADIFFNRIHLVFKDLQEYDIILHPASWLDELNKIKEIIPKDKRVKVNFSRLRFSK
jgi:hypothetical protein